ncbi:MAG: amidohydrolase family protein [Candidatus Spechtbacteria bacterium]|nr:amidohydrolase family protein [Candidatus Spechtbacteria bacterium]
MSYSKLIDPLEKLVRERGALTLVDCHRHLDTAGTLTDQDMAFLATNPSLRQKWTYIDTKKREKTYIDGMPDRIDEQIRNMRRQGVAACRTYCPVDSTVGMHVLEAMLEAKAKWQWHGFYLQIAAYPFLGVSNATERQLLSRAMERADLLGCLPSRGRINEYDWETSHRNMKDLFSIAFEHDKPIDLQIDQDNDPSERETRELLEVAYAFRRRGYDKGINATHCISLGAYNRADWPTRIVLLYNMRQLNISVVVCPSAARDMLQRSDKDAPIHNSIAPWLLLLGHGITVGMGADNVHDIYGRLNNGDLFEEARQMVGAVRYQGSLEVVADIMTVNGRKILGLE